MASFKYIWTMEGMLQGQHIPLNFLYSSYIYMSHLMTKPTVWLCSQRRLGLAWASAQSDQSSLWAQWVAKDPVFLHADSGLIRLRGCPGWSEFTGRTCHFAGFVMRQLIRYVFHSTASLQYLQLPDFRDPLLITHNHDLDPEEIAERLKQQQQESEKDARWLMAEERNLVSIITEILEPLHDKTNKMMCAQRRLRSAWASATSDQSLHCALSR